MNRAIPIISSALLILVGKPAYTAGTGSGADETPPLDPSKHVRIVYNKFNVPDSIIFQTLMSTIHSFDESTFFGKELEDWVYQEMNTTYSPEMEAWYMPRNHLRRHSSEDIQEIAGLLHDVSDKWHETILEAQRDAFCNSEKYTTLEKKLAVLERAEIEADVEADFYLEFTMERLSEQSRADLRAWLSRRKQGFSGTRYDARTMWLGHEGLLDEKFVALCEAAGGKE